MPAPGAPGHQAARRALPLLSLLGVIALLPGWAVAGLQVEPSGAPPSAATSEDGAVCEDSMQEACESFGNQTLGRDGFAVQGDSAGFEGGGPKAPTPWETTQAVATHPATWTAAALVAVGIGLYHRFRGQFALHHPLRASILRRAQERPGILASEVAAAEQVALNTVLHHVRVLEREDHLRVRNVGRSGLLFPKSMPPQEREVIAALHPAIARGILSACRELVNPSAQDLADRFGVTDRAIRSHLARLEDAGLVERLDGALRGRIRLTVAGDRNADPAAPLVRTDVGEMAAS